VRTAEGLLIGDIIHKQNSHGASVVRRGDGSCVESRRADQRAAVSVGCSPFTSTAAERRSERGRVE
jgi:hypothetical protein